MRYFSLPVQHKKNLSAKCGLFALMLLLFSAANGLAVEGDPAGENTITGVSSVQHGNTLDITIQGTTPPTYTVYELFKPARIVVDIAEATLASNAAISLPEKSGLTLTTSNITDTTPPLTRFTFTLKESRPFSVVQKGKNIAIILNTEKQPAQAAPSKSEAGVASEINDIKVLTTPNETKVQLLANGKVSSYSYDVLEKKGNTPPRLYIDVNNVTGDTLIKEQKVGTALAGIRVAKRGTGLRFVFDSSADTLFPFQVSPLKNGVEIRIQESAKSDDELTALIHRKQTIESQLPEINPLQLKSDAVNAQSVADSMEDAFNFSGYNKERITVDFYKIDLHNVFRLLREVSKTNIVVDESVSGSLTLALNDVPWDFALDIILNLKDLQKEERFNTIVILPKNKTFAWPERAENNLNFETDESVTEQEAILINQQQHIPETVVQAKQLIAKAQQLENREDFENAITLYQQAFEKWPDNATLAGKIASLYLVQLRQNSKATFFAKQSLEIDPKNSSAALTAAIALANMEESAAAQRYFDQATSSTKPSTEALLSYAAFSEQQQKYSGALKILKRYNELYGESLASMVSTGRVLDKMGKHGDATKAYKAILLSGYRIPPDLKKFIKGRVALSPSL